MDKTVTIESNCEIKINTGNWETVNVSKKIVVEITYSTPEELLEKSGRIDRALTRMVKEQADSLLKEIGRSRYTKVGGRELRVGTWEDFEATQTPDPDAA